MRGLACSMVVLLCGGIGVGVLRSGWLLASCRCAPLPLVGALRAALIAREERPVLVQTSPLLHCA